MNSLPGICLQIRIGVCVESYELLSFLVFFTDIYYFLFFERLKMN